MVMKGRGLKTIFEAWLLVVFLFVAAACQKDVLIRGPFYKGGNRSFTVSFEQGLKSELNDGYQPVWTVGEEVSVYDPVAGKACIFVVTESDGVTATIKGNISEGDFAISAVYPASAVNSWTDATTCSYSIPVTQVVPAGKDIAPDVLVSAAISQSQDQTIVFENKTSLLTFSVDTTDIKSVDFVIGGADNYRVTASSGCFEKGKTYFAAIQPGSYDGGLSTTCTSKYDVSYQMSSSNTLNAARSKYIGLGSLTAKAERRYSYEIFGEDKFSDFMDLFDKAGYLDDIGSVAQWFIELVLWPLIPNKDKDMHVYKYTYTSPGPDGEPLKMSSVLYVYEDAVSGSYTVDGIALVNHETIMTDAECPSNQSCLFGAVAWKDFAAIGPDYLGFGSTVKYPQAYLMADMSARHNLDAYFAGEQILKDKKIKVKDKRYNLGYSQGGYNAVNNLKYVSQHPGMGLSFGKTFAGDGPYDVRASLSDYLSGNFDECNAYIALSILSMVDYGQTGLSYSDILKGPILTNYYNWFVTKTYSASSIRSRIGADVTDFVREDIIDGTSPAFAKLMEEADRNSLCAGGWRPQSGSQLYVCHSTKDDMVPYSNFEALKSYLSGVSGCHFESNSAGGHSDVLTLLAFLKICLSNW